MTWALVTGASSGLGAEYARQLGMRGADLVLVGRDRARLDEVASEVRSAFGVVVDVMVADLLHKRDLAKVEKRLAQTDQPIDVLVNNAGFGVPLTFEKNDIAREVDHLRLHVEIPMRLCHAALEQMLPRQRGRILNIASVAAYMPRSTYGACKQWLVSFSRWANVTYQGRGVTMTAVCPGFTHTHFHERMGLPPGKEGVANWMWLESSNVVEESLRDAARGKSVSVPSLRYRLLVALAKVLPDSVTASLGQKGR